MPLPPNESEELTARAWLLAVIVLIGALVGMRACDRAHAHAQVDDVDELLAVAVARVAAHESGFRSPADLALIWQATRGHGDTSAERLAWLELHSPRALTGPHWSASLPSVGLEEPMGWPAAVRWSRFAPRWESMLAASRRLVGSDAPPRTGWPCSRTPQTWGGRELDAAHVARNAHVYIALDCRDSSGAPTRNEGYRYRRPAR